MSDWASSFGAAGMAAGEEIANPQQWRQVKAAYQSHMPQTGKVAFSHIGKALEPGIATLMGRFPTAQEAFRLSNLRDPGPITVGLKTGRTWAGSTWGQRAMGVAGTGLRAAAGPLFLAGSTVQGYREGGFIGAGQGLGKGIVGAAVGEHAVVGLVNAWKAGKVQAAARSMGPMALRTAGTVLLPAAMTTMGVGFITSQTSRSAMYRKSKLPLETAGSLASFQTRGATTMRQRSVQAIQRSHINARSAFGQEASYQAISSFRGI